MPTQATQFNIQPNGVGREREWMWLVIGLVVFSVGIGVRLAWLGFWMVLPFAVLDVLAVTCLVRFLRRKADYRERVCIKPQEVEVFHLEKGKNASWSFPLYWARVNLVQPKHRWYPRRLVLGASGKWVEIGQCLTDEERGALAEEIRAEIGRVKNCNNPSSALLGEGGVYA